MLWLKACPRCHGDVQDGSDRYGPYVACIQCGYYLSFPEEALLGRAGRREPGLAARPVVERVKVT
jgi:hypothetical protein